MTDREVQLEIDWLLGLQPAGVTLGLQRINALLMKLGTPQNSFRAVTVAGTNGKGSSARTLAGILTAAGIRTGLYTSPHLSRLGERMRVDGAEATREQIARLIR